jgi:predicted glycoside hydrolase/deacetylase ChbG (UPF0249 family)
MKLLFQSDDYGITEGVTCGALKGIRDGLVRNTGLFVNMPSSRFAAEQIKYYPQCCFGIDINLVAGRPISPVDQVPNLVKGTGEFYTSGEIVAKTNISLTEMNTDKMENDPYPFDETMIEAENQVKRFIELVGKKPGYIQGHSLITPNINKAIETIAEKYEIPYTMNFLKEFNFHWVSINWYLRPFPIEKQLQTDVEERALEVIPEILDYENSFLVSHVGFVDEDLFRCSNYTVIRAKDLCMACSPRLKAFIEENHVELVRYDDFKKG